MSHRKIPVQQGRQPSTGASSRIYSRDNVSRYSERARQRRKSRMIKRGILGTVLSGWFSDKLFKGDRKVPALIFGVLNAAALALFFYGGNAMWVNVLSMVLFGIAIGVLICFLGGLMAVDIVPRKATGAALGVVGMTSYIAAGIQDVASGWLIDSNITVAADGVKHYDFGPVAIFWLAAAVISFLLPLLNRGKVKEF